jgi:hypothetical protein
VAGCGSRLSADVVAQMLATGTTRKPRLSVVRSTKSLVAAWEDAPPRGYLERVQSTEASREPI